MPNNLRRKRPADTIDDHVDEIIGRLASNPAVEKTAKLPLNVASLQKNFNAQVELVLEHGFAEDERALWKKTLSLDGYKTFSDTETLMFVKTFGDCLGMFGFGDAGGNFKILSLCFTKPEKIHEARMLNLVFAMFTKLFLPEIDTPKLIAVLKKIHFFAEGELVFEFVQNAKLNMLDVFVE